MILEKNEQMIMHGQCCNSKNIPTIIQVISQEDYTSRFGWSWSFTENSANYLGSAIQTQQRRGRGSLETWIVSDEKIKSCSWMQSFQQSEIKIDRDYRNISWETYENSRIRKYGSVEYEEGRIKAICKENKIVRDPFELLLDSCVHWLIKHW